MCFLLEKGDVQLSVLVYQTIKCSLQLMFGSCVFDQAATPDKLGSMTLTLKELLRLFSIHPPFSGATRWPLFYEFLGQTNGSYGSRETSSLYWPEVQSIYWGMMLLGHTSIHSDVRLSMEVLILDCNEKMRKINPAEASLHRFC